jgi:uncharacterized membrane protein
MKLNSQCSLGLLLGLLFSVAGLNAQITFTGLILINPFNDPAGSSAFGINANGGVLGNDQSNRAFIWSAGSATQIVNTLGDRRVDANEINASGQVVGRALQSSGPDQIFIWTSGAGMTEISNTLSAGDAEANGINNAGTVVGQVAGVGMENRRVAFRWTAGGGMVELVNSVYATGESDANAINQYSQVGGVVYDENYDSIAVRWESDGSATVLSLPVDWRSPDVRGINSAGWLVGTVIDDEEGFYRPFLWNGAEVQILGSLGEDSDAYGSGLNDFGQVVGESTSGAFLFSDGQMYALNDLAAEFLVGEGEVGFQSLLWANGINNSGDIVGVGEYFDGVNFYEAGFLLTTSAIPEPSTYAAIFGGMVLLGALIRRRYRSGRQRDA